MKIAGKGLAVVAAPVLMAAALLGVPLAGSAHALERLPNCAALNAEAEAHYEDSIIALLNEYDALQAGDVGDYIYYAIQAARDEDLGNSVSAYANNHGC